MAKRQFKEIPISTRTIIVSTNTTIKIEDMYNNLPITPYEVIEKKRGRKKKDYIKQIQNTVENGSIISVKYQGDVRGVELKKKKKSSKFFRNAVTIIISVNGKLINLKISANGKFQVTGCKNFENCEMAIKNLFDIILQNIDIYLESYEDNIKILFNNVMTNKDFSVGFIVNRENLDKIINNDTGYRSLLETSFGYTGVNLKMKLDSKLERKFNCISLKVNTKEYNNYKMGYEEYVSNLNEKELSKENKDRHITFLVFQSGNVIMSGMNEEFMEKYYNIFFDIIEQNRDKVMDKIIK
jgi:TATA-box binding protein (TBP) (component of TFIID and TFIIIB)